MISVAGPEGGPLKISVTGIDGSGKDTATELALLDMSATKPDFQGVKLGHPSYYYDQGISREIFAAHLHTYERFHRFTQEHRLSALAAAVNGLDVLIHSRRLEPFVLNGRLNDLLGSLSLMACIRDSRIDPSIHMTVYGPRISRSLSLEKRIHIAQKLTGSKRDLIFWLNTDPRVALARVRRKIADQDVPAKRAVDIHETVEDLSLLSAAYYAGLTILREHQPTPVVEIETSERTAEETAGVISKYVDEAALGALDPEVWDKI